MPKKAEPTSGGGIVCFIIAAILAAVGLFLLVGGIAKQVAGFPWSTVMLWYFGGFILFMLGKFCKWKAGVYTCR